MEIFYNSERSGYDEIVSYGPKWWTEYREMNANYKFAGWTLDLMAHFLERTVKNQFPSEADERTIRMLEKMLRIEHDANLTLEDRRRIVSAYYSGAGHLSRSVIKSLAMAYTGSECEVWWIGTILQIRIMCEDDSWFSNRNFYSILSRRMPAHIAFYLRNMLCVFVLAEIVKYDKVRFRSDFSWWDGSLDGEKLLDGEWLLDREYPPFFKTKHTWYSDSSFTSVFDRQKYLFVNGMEWNHEIYEKYRMHFNWWENSLDGENNLDGGMLLNAVYPPFFVTKNLVSVENDIGISHTLQSFAYKNENNFHSQIYSAQRLLLNWWDEITTLDGRENLDGSSLLNHNVPPEWRKEIYRMPVESKEAFTVTMFVPGNAKLLDGTAFLDGNINLNSGREEL